MKELCCLEGFDDALIGHSMKPDGHLVLCYDIEKVIRLCMEFQEWDYATASDYFWTSLRWEFGDDFIYISCEEAWSYVQPDESMH